MSSLRTESPGKPCMFFKSCISFLSLDFIQQVFFEHYHGLDAIIYIFISLNSPNYPIKWVLSPVYRQSIVNISLCKNILLPMRGKNRKGTRIFCLYSFHLVASCFCFYRHFLSQSSYSLSFKPYLYSLLLLAVLCSLLGIYSLVLKYFKILSSFIHLHH